jgi:hypothetical protein
MLIFMKRSQRRLPLVAVLLIGGALVAAVSVIAAQLQIGINVLEPVAATSLIAAIGLR